MDRTYQTLLKRRGDRDNHGWMSVGELMVEHRSTQAEVIAALRSLFATVALEFIPGNGIVHNRYRLQPGNAALAPEVEAKLVGEPVQGDAPSPATTPESTPLLAPNEPGGRLEAMATTETHGPEPAQADPRDAAIGMEVGTSVGAAVAPSPDASADAAYTGPERRKASNKRSAGAERTFVERRGARDRSGRFNDGSDVTGAMGALVQIPVMTIEPGTTQGDAAVVVVDLKRRPGSSRIAIALEDAVRIGQQAVEAMLLKSGTSAPKPPAGS